MARSIEDMDVTYCLQIVLTIKLHAWEIGTGPSYLFPSRHTSRAPDFPTSCRSSSSSSSCLTSAAFSALESSHSNALNKMRSAAPGLSILPVPSCIQLSASIWVQRAMKSCVGLKEGIGRIFIIDSMRDKINELVQFRRGIRRCLRRGRCCARFCRADVCQISKYGTL